MVVDSHQAFERTLNRPPHMP